MDFKNKIKQKFYDFKSYIQSLPFSIVIFHTATMIALLILINSIFNDFIFLHLYFLSFLYAVAYIVQLIEDSKIKTSVISKLIYVHNFIKPTLFYKLTVIFFTVFLGALAYSKAQQLVANTMNLTPNYFFNSVAVSTPLISLLFALIVIIFVMLISILLMWLVIIFDSMKQNIKLFFMPFLLMFYSIFILVLKGEQEATEILSNNNHKSLTNKRSKLYSLIGIISLSYYLMILYTIFSSLLVDDKFIELRKSIIVQLDYFPIDYCSFENTNERILRMSDTTFSRTTMTNNKWEIETISCKL